MFVREKMLRIQTQNGRNLVGKIVIFYPTNKNTVLGYEMDRICKFLGGIYTKSYYTNNLLING